MIQTSLAFSLFFYFEITFHFFLFIQMFVSVYVYLVLEPFGANSCVEPNVETASARTERIFIIQSIANCSLSLSISLFLIPTQFISFSFLAFYFRYPNKKVPYFLIRFLKLTHFFRSFDDQSDQNPYCYTFNELKRKQKRKKKENRSLNYTTTKIQNIQTVCIHCYR